MSSRMRPGRQPWLKKLKRIVGRRLRSGSLSTEDALHLCDELLPSIQRRPPPPAVSTEPNMPRRRRDDRRPCWVLGRFIGECYRSGDLGPEDALDLFDELLPQAVPASVYAISSLSSLALRPPPQCVTALRSPSPSSTAWHEPAPKRWLPPYGPMASSSAAAAAWAAWTSASPSSAR
ncbi:hypothetical protein ACP70R_021057 [Stipagrostis hirtigluma subsp. patula]